MMITTIYHRYILYINNIHNTLPSRLHSNRAGQGRYLVAAVGCDSQRTVETVQWRAEWAGLVRPSTSWRSLACTPAVGCGGSWEACSQEGGICTGPGECEVCTRGGKLELEMKDWSLLCSRMVSDLRSRRCRIRP